MAEPRDLVQQLESNPSLPGGQGERFSGYGVMACPFASGDILCHRRFPASSVGPAYTSVWHRDPQGAWRFYQDVPPQQACPRFFGSALTSAAQTDVELTWTGARSFRIRVDGGATVDWELHLKPTAMTRMMNTVGRAMPEPLWRNAAVLKAMGAVAGVALGAGKLALAGSAPNRQRYVANPMLIWTIAEARATVGGRDLGRVAPLPEQARLGDFWIPRAPLFVIGRAYFDAFDPARHLATTSQTSRA